MPLSKKKQAAMELAERRRKVNARSLDGKGYFMDAGDESDVRRYLETGDETILNQLPDYGSSRRTTPCRNPYKHDRHVWHEVRKPQTQLMCPGKGSGAH
jgi:hypothetical protein